MNWLSEFCVRRPITVIMSFIMIVVLGAVAYRNLPVQLFPDITLPTIGVWAQRESSAEDNLDTITRPLEALLGEVPRVKRVRSWTRGSEIWIQAEFEFGTDMRVASLDIDERLVGFQQNLNDRRVFINSFPFSTEEFQTTYMYLAIRGGDDREVLFDIVRDKIEQQLKAIEGVAKIEVLGSSSDAAVVELDANLMAGYGLSFERVLGKLNAAAREDAFLGRLRVPGETHFVQLQGRVRTVAELAEVPVDDRGLVKLKDIAVISQGKALDSWVYRADGKNSLGIEIERENGANMIELARKTRTRIQEINATLPPGVELVIDEDLAKYVEDAIASVKELAIFGSVLALLVPLVFFRSLKVAFIVFLAVPICLIAVFNLFAMAGMSINMFSIIGLAIGVGMVVDNSIVVCENAFRLYGTGLYTAREAAIKGSGDVGKALLASTSTTGIVFLPFLFLEGDFRLFVKEPTLALVFPLVISYFVAVTLSPVLAYLTLRGMGAQSLHQGSRHFRDAYRLVLKWTLRHRAATIGILAGVIVFTIFESFGAIEQRSTRREEEGNFVRVYMQVPRGSRLSDVNRPVSIVEDRLSRMEDVERFATSFNTDGARFNIRLKELKDRPSKRSTSEFRSRIVEEIGEVEGAELSLRRFDMPVAAGRITSGEKGDLEIRGSEMSVILPYVERLTDALRLHPAVTRVELEQENEDPQYQVLVDRERTRLFNINANTIGQYIQSTRASGTISRIRLIDGDKRTDVSIAFSGMDGGTVENTKAMAVFSPTGGIVRLGDLTQMQASVTERRIRRVNRQSSVDLSYYWRPGTNSWELTEDLKQIISQVPNPGGVVVEFAGEAMKLQEREQDVGFVAASGLVLVYIVMAAVFESFWVPMVIAFMVGLVPLGIKWGLKFMGLPLDDLAVFGGILLIGLVVNSGIVMMDRTLELIRSGHARRLRAMFESADTRLRPILMTYLTTVLGLLPMALKGDETSPWRPVAVAIIGGLTSSTLLTLLALPALYLVGDDFVRFVRRPFIAMLALAFRTLELAMNLATTLLLGILCFWRWRPLVALRAARRGARFVLGHLKPEGVLKLLRIVLGALRRGAGAMAQLARDGAFLLRTLLWFPKRTAKPDTIEPVATLTAVARTGGSEEVPVRVENLQVLYAAGGFSALRRYLPSKRYALGARPAEGVHALQGVSLEIEPGLYGLVGPNGAGKTTMMRCIAGLIAPTRGTVRLYGTAHREAPAMLAPLIGYLPQSHGHYEHLTLYEFLEYFATLTARTLARAKAVAAVDGEQPMLRSQLGRLAALEDPTVRDRAIWRAIEEVNLLEFAHERIAGFSGGMKQRAGIARILLQAPPLLIVDEPTAGLDPVERVKVRLLLAQLAANRTVIFSTHIVEDLEQSCRGIGILLSGRLAYHGTPGALRERWQGQLWEVLAEDPSHAPQLRQSLAERGARVLFQIVRGGREGFRILAAPAAKPPGAQPVVPTLEDALLATLGERRAAK